MARTNTQRDRGFRFRTPFNQRLRSLTKLLSLLLAAAIFSFVSCGSARKSTTASAKTEAAPADEYANFYVDFMRTDKLSVALAEAEAQDKMVFIDFYTSWCLPCKLMDEDVFTDRAFGDFMNERFVSVKIDAERGNGPNLAMLYGVQAYPTLLFLDSKGRVLAKKEGAAYQTELRRMGTTALASATEG